MRIWNWIWRLQRTSLRQILLFPVIIAACLGFYWSASASERLFLKLGRSAQDARITANLLIGPLGGLLTAAVVIWLLRRVFARFQELDDKLDTLDK